MTLKRRPTAIVAKQPMPVILLVTETDEILAGLQKRKQFGRQLVPSVAFLNTIDYFVWWFSLVTVYCPVSAVHQCSTHKNFWKTGASLVLF